MPHFQVIVSANAQKDIQQAIDWENERAAGLGNRFFQELDDKLGVLAHHPLSGTIRYDEVRCVQVPVFSYLIHYLVYPDSGKLIVLRVLHTARQPNW